jgi:hypothetical protein
MRKSTVRIFCFLVIPLILGSPLKAEPLREFLVSCAYGTVAGALVGVASLAFTDDPSSKMNNIARGASLGLYAGIGLGLYKAYGNPNVTSSTQAATPSRLWLALQWHQAQIDGVGMHGTLVSF